MQLTFAEESQNHAWFLSERFVAEVVVREAN